MSLTDQQVLITGATGFLGSALARRLAADGAAIRALVRSPQKAEPLLVQGIDVVYGDLTDADSLRRAVAGCRVVFHVGAALGGSYAQQEAVNVGGTRALLDAAQAAGVERFVHVSSISVYGYNVRGSVTEEAPLAPGADPYGLTKAAGEKLVRACDLDYTVIRPGMIYGPGAVNWTGGLFRVAKLNPTPFVGNGHGSAFPIYVDDVVDLLVTAADHPAAARQAFNCTPDPAPAWREFLGRYSQLAGHERWLPIPPQLLYPLGWLALLIAPRYSMLGDVLDQISFVQRQVTYKMDKARDLLGWQPQVDLDDGIARCAPWLRDQGLLP